jgi:hypothetical protein
MSISRFKFKSSIFYNLFIIFRLLFTFFLKYLIILNYDSILLKFSIDKLIFYDIMYLEIEILSFQ